MVHIAIAGGSGQVAREVIDALLMTKKHEITILSRHKQVPITDTRIQLQTVNYKETISLVQSLQGVHTVLSFIQVLSDSGQEAQKNLIDAAISAGVKRFAPSEFGSKETIHMPWWAGKEKVRSYLKEVSKHANDFEYTLFQPGLFLEYLAYPFKTSKYLEPLQTIFDFQNNRAILVDGHEHAIMTLTAVADFASIIARAVEDERKWPIISGIQSNKLSFSRVVEIGSQIRGQPLDIEKVRIEDLEAGNLETLWRLEGVHRSVDTSTAYEMRKKIAIGILLSSSKGAWDISDEMNQRYPDHRFISLQCFLERVWGSSNISNV
ncbi:uncharacterized protein PV09_04550 [Verruconis gallopava]|uniref:NmrA-like domain-containing protein n=1 Tax=Verruconis gallopava TaxID=253628 RepID=A0A0D2ACP5_9PEZI|nr:uncharacterized protein PV09_04550 [Verruconis gallopava]KIW04245.1 hypothetical protein PV09_04550 [Verruconis gallopava]